MKVNIDIKNEKNIIKISKYAERSNSYVVNAILDYYFVSENATQKIKQIFKNNIEKIELDTDDPWYCEGGSGGSR